MAPTQSYSAPGGALSAVAARDLLQKKPAELFSVSPETTVLATIAEMADHHIGAVVVLIDDRLAGIVSERDCMVRCVLQGKSAVSTPVSEIMTTEVLTIELSSTVKDCMQLMTTRRVRHLPVVDAQRVIGVLSIGDVVREALHQQTHTIEELERYVTGTPSLVPEASAPR